MGIVDDFCKLRLRNEYFGLINRPMSEHLLRISGQGSFLFRFSPKQNQLCLSYHQVGNQSQLFAHILGRDEGASIRFDIGQHRIEINDPNKFCESLPDYLHTCVPKPLFSMKQQNPNPAGNMLTYKVNDTFTLYGVMANNQNHMIWAVKTPDNMPQGDQFFVYQNHVNLDSLGRVGSGTTSSQQQPQSAISVPSQDIDESPYLNATDDHKRNSTKRNSSRPVSGKPDKPTYTVQDIVPKMLDHLNLQKGNNIENLKENIIDLIQMYKQDPNSIQRGIKPNQIILYKQPADATIVNNLMPLPQSLPQIKGVVGDRIKIIQIFSNELAEASMGKEAGFIRTDDFQLENKNIKGVDRTFAERNVSESLANSSHMRSEVSQFENKIGVAIKTHAPHLLRILIAEHEIDSTKTESYKWKPDWMPILKSKFVGLLYEYFYENRHLGFGFDAENEGNRGFFEMRFCYCG